MSSVSVVNCPFNEEEKGKENKQIEELPKYEYMVRPGAPAVAPIFRKSSHLKTWESNERKQNKKYSNEVYYEKMSAWRKRHNWHDVPLMTSMTKEEAGKGFREIKKYELEIKEEKMKKQDQESRGIEYVAPCVFSYLVPHDANRGETFYLEFLSKMMYNRANELCGCKTVGEFEKVYEDSSNLEKGFWLLGLRERTAHDALEAFSVESNLFPGRKATTTTCSDDDDDAPRTRTTSKERRNTFCERRGKLGICGVKDLETLGTSAPIEWYISPEEMRNMKRFEFCFEMSPEEIELMHDMATVDEWWDNEAYNYPW
jgi:hypothetical protein